MSKTHLDKIGLRAFFLPYLTEKAVKNRAHQDRDKTAQIYWIDGVLHKFFSAWKNYTVSSNKVKTPKEESSEDYDQLYTRSNAPVKVLKKLAKTDDIAKQVFYFADVNTSITGEMIKVDCGFCYEKNI